MKAYNVRKTPYIYDPLYGILRLPDFVWKIIPCAELQRLREIRLCNVNSFCLLGGANINRYEHAIGTCYLAIECLKHWPDYVNKREQKQFILAALLHDVLNGPFGHSLEYIESKEGYYPTSDFKRVMLEKESAQDKTYPYKRARLEPFFFGWPKELVSKVSEEDIDAIDEIIDGRGRFGPLINGVMDLDNIDNVFRFAYHMGITKEVDLPLNLARSIWIEKGELVVRKEALSLVQRWHNVRKHLYTFLLLNPEEFSAKCMISEVIEFAKAKTRGVFTWHDTDYEFLLKLSKIPPVKEKVMEPLFEASVEFREELKNHLISKKFRNLFEQVSAKLSERAYIEETNGKWKIHDGTKVYIIADREPNLQVFKLHLRGFEISKIIQRLMKGELYGCIGIFSTSKTENETFFENEDQRRELENRISFKVRNKIRGRFRNAIILFHMIKDINKTERQVILRTDDGVHHTIGKRSNRLLLGAFFRNSHLTMHRVDHSSPTLRGVRNEVRAFLSDYLKNPNLIELKLYEEAGSDAKK